MADQQRRPPPVNSANPTPTDFNSNNPFRTATTTSRSVSPIKSPNMATAPPQHIAGILKSPQSSHNPFLDPSSPPQPQQEFDNRNKPRDDLTKNMVGLSVRPVDDSARPRVDPRSPEKRPVNPNSKRPIQRPVQRPSSRDEKRDMASPDKGRRSNDQTDSKDTKDAPPTDKESKTSRSRSTRPFDLIDTLDQSGAFGKGITPFHHDGPFDAARLMNAKQQSSKSRSKKVLRPIDAFAKDSGNMTITGANPTGKSAKDQQYDILHMVNDEAHGDFNSASTTKRPELQPMDATARGEQIHSNNETPGLGTSTFLEGAPAARNAMMRRESEAAASREDVEAGGLGRTASLLRPFQSRNRGLSHGARPLTSDSSAVRRYPPNSMAQSAGGMARATPGQETCNPFEYMEPGRNQTVPLPPMPMGPSTDNSDRPLPPPSLEGFEKTLPPQGSGGPGFLRRLKSVKRDARPAPVM